MQKSKSLLNITRVTYALALAVIVLGAYVRLSDAGLGCPDWPSIASRPKTERHLKIPPDMITINHQPGSVFLSPSK